MVLAYLEALPEDSNKASMMDVVDDVLFAKDVLGEVHAFTAMKYNDDGVLVLVTEWHDSDVITEEALDVMLYDQFELVVAFLHTMDKGDKKTVLQRMVTSHEEYLALADEASKTA